jgi:hypothetical protein
MAVAPSLIRRAAWPMAAAVALAFLVALALHGERPEPGLVGFKAAGLLTAFDPADAREIEVSRAGEVWRFRREGSSWRAVEAPRPVPAEAAERIDTALRLLRDSGPLRVLSAGEVARTAPSDYALGPEALRVTVLGPDAATFAIVFGAANPLGSARYVRIEGIDGVPLLPAYVAEIWEQAIGAAVPR